MGAFNELILGDGTRIQFKFGERWQHEYRLGDRIVFREDQSGHVGCNMLSGLGRSANGSHAFYRITLENGVLTEVVQVDEPEYDRLERQELDE